MKFDELDPDAIYNDPSLFKKNVMDNYPHHC